jgi:hypothetical protein
MASPIAVLYITWSTNSSITIVYYWDIIANSSNTNICLSFNSSSFEVFFLAIYSADINILFFRPYKPFFTAVWVLLKDYY